MLRAVLDTNVLVSAIISDGKARDLLKKAIADQYRIVTSDLILKELATVLQRPKFKTSPDQIKQVILAINRTADVITVKTRIKAVKVDPKDDMIIATAIDGKANLIVTGDSDLLTLKTFREVQIISIEEMLAYLSKNKANPVE
ncbi:MAG: putative toxin-antitoxin system toxin component, PIN family [Candidatus Bathyarchaeota archaeon]|nr:putative toxin-antitoxin system toxin component, PIN family [Candidatus Bathyarchaeota archaeon]